MSELSFVLEPYPGTSAPAGAQITGQARRAGTVLHLEWRLEAPEGSVALAEPAPIPERRRELWEQTCFEFFLASPSRPGYWEFNLSPAGHWNVFRFEGYRIGMTDESAFQALPFEVSRPPGSCVATASLDLSTLGLGSQEWRLAIAMVVAKPDGPVSYWALTHPGTQPDFHHPDAFVAHLVV